MCAVARLSCSHYVTTVCLQSVYGYLSLLGGSALLASPVVEPESASIPAAPAPAPAPAPVVVPVVPVVPAAAPAPSTESLTAVYARLDELQTKLAALQTGYQVRGLTSCMLI